MGVSVWIENNKHETSRQAGRQDPLQTRPDSDAEQSEPGCTYRRSNGYPCQHRTQSMEARTRLCVGSGGCLAGWWDWLWLLLLLSLCLDEFVMCANFPSGTQICQDKKFTSMFGNWLLIAEILHLNPWDAVPTDEYELVHGQSSSPSIERRCLILVVHIIIITSTITVITTTIHYTISFFHHSPSVAGWIHRWDPQVWNNCDI